MSIKNFINQETNAFACAVNSNDRTYALSEWLTAKATAVNSFLTNIAEVMELVDDENDEPRSEAEISRIVEIYCAQHGLDTESGIILPSGISNLSTFLTKVIYEQERYVKGVTPEWITKKFPVYDNDGVEKEEELGAAIDWLKTASSSALIECSALSAAFHDTPADRVTVFNSKVNSLLGNVSSKYNSYINYWNTLLSDVKVKSNEFVKIFTDNVSLSSTYESYDENDNIAKQYTGASTRYIYSWNLNWKNFGQGIVSVLKICFLAPYIVTKWSIDTFNKACGWLHNKIRKSLTNPNDIDILNDSDEAKRSVDSFCYSFQVNTALSNLQTSPISSVLTQYDNVYQWMLDYGPKVGDVFKFNLAIGEIVLSVDEYNIDRSDFGASMVKFTVNYKPYPLNGDSYSTLVHALHTSKSLGTNEYTYNYSNNDSDSDYIVKQLTSFADAINLYGDNIYTEELDTSGWDSRFYNGLSMSMSLFIDLMGFLKAQMAMGSSSVDLDHQELTLIDDNGVSHIANVGYINGGVGTDGLIVPYDYTYGYVPSDPTNIQMIKMASGYNDYNGVSYFDIPPFITQVIPNNNTYPSRPDTQITNGLLKGAMMVLLSLVFYNQVSNEIYKVYPSRFNSKQPIGYFIPYIKNKETFMKSRYYVLSDAERNKIVSDNINKVIIITVIAITVTLAAISINKVIRRVRINRIAAQGVLDNKMWSGQKLTASEARRYFRLARKNGNLNDYSSDLLGMAVDEVKSGLPTNDSMANFAELWRLISGEPLS